MITAQEARQLAETKTDWFDDFISKLNLDIVEKAGKGLKQMNTASIPDPAMLDKIENYLTEAPRSFLVECLPKSNYLIVSWQ